MKNEFDEPVFFDKCVALAKVGFFIWCWYASGSFWVGVGCWFFLEFCIFWGKLFSRSSGSLVSIALLFLGVGFLLGGDDDCDL